MLGEKKKTHIQNLAQNLSINKYPILAEWMRIFLEFLYPVPKPALQ